METQVKYFTVAEANRTLPLVKRIVRDIINTAYEIRSKSDLLGGHYHGNPDILKMSSQINEYIKELEEIGCLYKDWNFQIGLVDFPALINDKEVYLCWRSDEEEIKFYHELTNGYSDRKPIPPEYL